MPSASEKNSSERIISVKCEVNEKNKEAIKRALSVGLGLGSSHVWNGDCGGGKVNDERDMLWMKIEESLSSDGYKIRVSVVKTKIGKTLSTIYVGIYLAFSILLTHFFVFPLCLKLFIGLMKVFNIADKFLHPDEEVSILLGIVILAIWIGSFCLVSKFFASYWFEELPRKIYGKFISERLDEIERKLNS